MTVLSYSALVAMGTSALLMLGFCCWFHTGYIRQIRCSRTVQTLLSLGAWLPTVLVGTIVAVTFISNGVAGPVYYVGPLSTVALLAALAILSIFSFWFFCNLSNGETAADQRSGHCRPLTVYEVKGSCLLGWIPNAVAALLWAMPWFNFWLNSETALSFWSRHENISVLILMQLSFYLTFIMAGFACIAVYFLLDVILKAPETNRATPQGC